MNKDRRTQIDAAIKQMEALGTQYSAAIAAILDIKGEMESLKDEIEAIRDEEQEYQDNMPENMQGGDRYEQAGAAISELDAAIEAIETITDHDYDPAFDPDDVIGPLQAAKG